jgi:hypothetical protein
MTLIDPTPDLPDETEINDVLLPFRFATVLNRARGSVTLGRREHGIT